MLIINDCEIQRWILFIKDMLMLTLIILINLPNDGNYQNYTWDEWLKFLITYQVKLEIIEIKTKVSLFWKLNPALGK